MTSGVMTAGGEIADALRFGEGDGGAMKDVSRIFS
jgi:hypothetical protein